jgi:hypothetical protein
MKMGNIPATNKTHDVNNSSISTPSTENHDAKWFKEQLMLDRKIFPTIPSDEKINTAKNSLNPRALLDVYNDIQIEYFGLAVKQFNDPKKVCQTLVKFSYYTHLKGIIYQQSLHDNEYACKLFSIALNHDKGNPLYQKEVDTVCSKK